MEHYQAEVLGAATGMTDVDQMIVTLMTSEIPFSQRVYELVSGVNVTDLNFGVQMIPVEQPIQSERLCGSVQHVSLWDFDL